MSQMMVPYVALPARARRVKAELMAAIERVIDHGIYILGPEVEEFERRFAAYCGVRYAVGVSDGTSALMQLRVRRREVRRMKRVGIPVERRLLEAAVGLAPQLRNGPDLLTVPAPTAAATVEPAKPSVAQPA